MGAGLAECYSSIASSTLVDTSTTTLDARDMRVRADAERL
jgi:hypothetical protein